MKKDEKTYFFDFLSPSPDPQKSFPPGGGGGDTHPWIIFTDEFSNIWV